MTTAGIIDSGSYYVAATSAYGVVVSRPALVQVGNPGLLGWGLNGNGQLGNATTLNATVPSWVTTNQAAGSAGVAHMMYVDNNGTLWGAGLNSEGQLALWATGKNYGTGNINIPVAGVNNVVAVSAGNNYTMYIDNNSTLWGVGDNTYGQMGLPGFQGYALYGAMPVASNVVAVAAGQTSTVFVQANGTLWGCGFNNYGVSNTNILRLVSSNVVAVAAGL